MTIRELRNHAGDVIDRVATGERVTVTRAGKAVAELRPVLRSRISAEAFIERSRHLLAVDLARFREDQDAVIDSSL